MLSRRRFEKPARQSLLWLFAGATVGTSVVTAPAPSDMAALVLLQFVELLLLIFVIRNTFMRWTS